MNQRPNVVIVMARCSHGRGSFGIRFEEKQPGHWTADWAFPIKEAAAKRQGYERGKISGTFGSDEAYPACPYCGGGGIFLCGACDKVACWDGEQRTVTCPWCGDTGEIGGHIERLSAGTDR